VDLNLRKSGFDKEERQTAYAGEAKPNDDAAATERSQSLRVRQIKKQLPTVKVRSYFCGFPEGSNPGSFSGI